MYSVLRIAFYKHISEILTKIVMEKPHYRGNLLLSNFSLGRFDIYNFPSGGGGYYGGKASLQQSCKLTER